MDNTILWTYQRTGGTTLKSFLELKGAVFGPNGEYGQTPLDEIPEVLKKVNSFKMGIGEKVGANYFDDNDYWIRMYRIIKETPDHINIIHYRENSGDRMLSWYLAHETGGFNPKKIALNKEKVKAFVDRDHIPVEILIRQEISDLKRLLHIATVLESKQRKIVVTRYEDFFRTQTGYGSRNYYESLSGLRQFKDIIDSNDEIRRLKVLINGKNNCSEELPCITKFKL